MESIVEFVSEATDEKSEGFIPVEDRIAVFDMDGTLTCETFYTYYDTMMFIEFCLKDHPERVSEELKEAAREIEPGYTAGDRTRIHRGRGAHQELCEGLCGDDGG